MTKARIVIYEQDGEMKIATKPGLLRGGFLIPIDHYLNFTSVIKQYWADQKILRHMVEEQKRAKETRNGS